MHRISVISAIFCLASAGIAQQVRYVSVAGNDLFGDGSQRSPYRTIQRGIDVSRDGDSVIVLEGTYLGAGNTNVQFRGKAITVTSREPDADACVRATIIDAQGQGVIVRFVNDESAASVFDGFTLLHGDVSGNVRGVAGFFEFSGNARPTTRRLRIRADLSIKSSPAGPRLRTGTKALDRSFINPAPFGGRAWDGHDPFHQPAHTTNYYGSGDVDGDGVLTSVDAQMAEEMVQGKMSPSTTADVDFSGMIDERDVALINSALQGTPLPAWWNALTTRDQRNQAIDRFLAVDRTNEHPYDPIFSFATQLALDGGFFRDDFSKFPSLSGGQTLFNLPIYGVIVSSTYFGHQLNAVLVGDNPLNPEDWRFIEPQTDGAVQPGMWNMPSGSTVSIVEPDQIWEWDAGRVPAVTFTANASGLVLNDHDPNLLTSRGSTTNTPVDNRPDLWNPRILSPTGGAILFNRQRDDMSRTTDVHISGLPLSDPPVAAAFTLDKEASYLLDASQGPDGMIHVLWTGTTNGIPGVFYGELNSAASPIQNVVRVTSNANTSPRGRLIIRPNGEVDAFWMVNGQGIFFNRKISTAWDFEQLVASYAVSDWPFWWQTSPDRYSFDAALAPDGTIVLAWLSKELNGIWGPLRYRRYNGTWDTTIDTDIDSGFEALPFDAPPIALAVDSDNLLHIAYLQLHGTLWQSTLTLYHQTVSGPTGSPRDLIADLTTDPNAVSYYPSMKMVAGEQGTVFLVWVKLSGGFFVPQWSKYIRGVWTPGQPLTIRPGADAWYPDAVLAKDGNLLVTWSSRSPDRASIEVATVPVLTPQEVGVFRSGFLWMLDSDGNGQFSGADKTFAFGGIAGDIPIAGDWNGSGTTKAGIYRSSTGVFLLDYNGDGIFNPAVDKVYSLGVGTQPGDVPVVGDWNGDGRSKIGIFRQGYFWILDTNGDGTFDAGDQSFGFGGVAGDVPVVGDWNGTGTSKVGIFRAGFLWILDVNGNHVLDNGDQVFPFGGVPGDVPVVGDWTGDGRTEVGVFRMGFFWVLDTNGNHVFDAGIDQAFAYGGVQGDKPVIGRWQ